MALNVSMIYRRTDRGVREVYEKSHQFTQSERLILILLDGRLNVAGLKTRLPSLNDERIERALRKLQDASLVEPMSYDASKGNGSTPAPAPLEPEAVAHFLEQTDLDPVTVFGDTEEAVAAELVRASVEQAAAQLAREATIMGSVGARPAPSEKARRPARRADSERSPQKRSKRSRTTGGYEINGASTHWAITTVNVPDRPDLQEERDRADAADYSDGRRRELLRVWMKRFLMIAVLAVIAAGVYATLAPLREETSASRVGERLTAVFKRPVRVAETDFSFSPTPRLTLRGIDAGGQFKADEVSLLINWKDLWSAVRGGYWVWGEAVIAPMSLTPAQAAYIVRSLPGGARELPSKISTIRLASVRIADSRLFPDAFEGVLRRSADGSFGPLVLRPLDTDGTMQLSFSPGRLPDGRETIEFRLNADRWIPPFGPRVRWNEVRATGRIFDNVVEVSDFNLAGFFGMTSGTVYAATDVEWAITGIAGASNIDVESVLQTLKPGTQVATGEGPPPAVQGTATMNLTIAGRGPTLDDAIARSAIAGPFQIRWATLNGINLGLAVSQGAMAAGVTRFTEFNGLMAASANGVRFEDTGGRAGAMAARGDFTVAPDLALAGGIRVELGVQRVQAPVSLRVRGTALAPRFSQ
ncbi:MAG TPA: hypothetical protein VES91_06480 [Burkholderiaceae bacterium]|nr:hypothetical protein [Burkholderiaceae bacterium]